MYEDRIAETRPQGSRREKGRRGKGQKNPNAKVEQNSSERKRSRPKQRQQEWPNKEQEKWPPRKWRGRSKMEYQSSTDNSSEPERDERIVVVKDHDGQETDWS